MGFNRTLSLTLATADDDNICLSQTPLGAGNLTINGAAATAGVATLDVGRRVLITCAGNNSGVNFTIYGTGLNGLSQSETMTGPNTTTGYTSHDFVTVTRVAISGASTGAVKVGTNGVGSTTPWIVDQWVNNPNIGLGTVVTGSVNYTLQFSMDNFAPLFDLNANTPTWYTVFGFDGITANAFGDLNQPCTMVRLTINSGTGSVTVNGLQSALFGPA